MEDNGVIFSSEHPGYKRAAAASEQEPKAKRKYSRKEKPAAVNQLKKVVGKLIEMPGAQVSSFGLEYVRALTRLLELIGEQRRQLLVQFIIDNKIV